MKNILALFISLLLGLNSFTQILTWTNYSDLDGLTFSNIESSPYLSEEIAIECIYPNGNVVTVPYEMTLIGTLENLNNTDINVFVDHVDFEIVSQFIPTGNGDFQISLPFKKGFNSLNLYFEEVGCTGSNCAQSVMNLSFYFLGDPIGLTAIPQETYFPHYNLVELGYDGIELEDADIDYQFLKTYPNLDGGLYPISDWLDEPIAHDWPNEDTYYFVRTRINGVESGLSCEFPIDANPYIPSPSNDQFINAYQYWFDHDLSSSQLTSVDLSLTPFLDVNLNVNNLSTGIHTYHNRFRDITGIWSVPITRTFYHSGSEESTIENIEYWFDDDDDNIYSPAIPMGNTIFLDALFELDNLSSGIHKICVRFRDSNNKWSIPITRYFLKNENSNTPDIVSYRYWINNEFKGEFDLPFASNPMDIETALFLPIDLPEGQHNASFQFKDSNGKWTVASYDEFEYDSDYIDWPNASIDSVHINVIHKNPNSIQAKYARFYTDSGPEILKEIDNNYVQLSKQPNLFFDNTEEIQFFDEDYNLIGHISYQFRPEDQEYNRHLVAFIHNDYQYGPYSSSWPDYDNIIPKWNYYEEGEFPVTMLIPPQSTMPEIYNNIPALLIHGVDGEFKHIKNYNSENDDVGYWYKTPRILGEESDMDVWQVYYPYDSSISDISEFIKTPIDFLRARYADPQQRLRVLTHSMGGLVFRNYLQNNHNHAQNNIEKVLFSAPPFHGSFNANRSSENIDAGEYLLNDILSQKDTEAPAYKDLSLASPFIFNLKNGELPVLNDNNEQSYHVLAGSTNDNFFEINALLNFVLGILLEEDLNHNDGVVSISSTSLLDKGIGLTILPGNHTDLATGIGNIDQPTLISNIANNFFNLSNENFELSMISNPFCEVVISDELNILKPVGANIDDLSTEGTTDWQRSLLQFKLVNPNENFSLSEYYKVDYEEETQSLVLSPKNKHFINPVIPERLFRRNQGTEENSYYQNYFFDENENLFDIKIETLANLSQISHSENIMQIKIYPYSDDDLDWFSITYNLENQFLQTNLMELDLSQPSTINHTVQFNVNMFNESVSSDGVFVEVLNEDNQTNIYPLTELSSDVYSSSFLWPNGLYKYRYINGSATESIQNSCSNDNWRTVYLHDDLVTELVCFHECQNCGNCFDLTSLLNICADTKVEIEPGVYELEGNVMINQLLEFSGIVTIDMNENKIYGSSIISIDNILAQNEVLVYNGDFELEGVNTTLESVIIDELNYQFAAGNIPIKIEELELISDGIGVSGSINFPDYFDNVSLEIQNISITQTGGIDLGGTLLIEDVSLINNTAELESLELEFNSFENTYSGSALIQTPLWGFGLNAHIEQGYLNDLGITYIPGDPIPIGTSGLGLTELNGSLSNISNGPLTFGIGCDIEPIIGNELDWLKIEDLSLNYGLGSHVHAFGNLELFGENAASMNLLIKPNLCQANYDINIQDILLGNGELTMAQTNATGEPFLSVLGSMGSSFVIPEPFDTPWWNYFTDELDFPITLGAIQSHFIHVPYSTSLWGYGYLPFADLYLNYTAEYTNGELNFDFDRGIIEQTIPESAMAFNSGDNLPYFWNLSDDLEDVFIEIINLSEPSEIELLITSPSGFQINTDEFESNLFYDKKYSEENNRSIFRIIHPEKGIWQFQILNESNPEISWAIDGLSIKPEIELLPCQITDSGVLIEWLDSDIDSDAVISLFYDNDGKNGNGVLISQDIAENFISNSYFWNTDSIPTGNYFISAVITDEKGLGDLDYASESVFINNSFIPQPINEMISFMNDSIFVNWNNANESLWTLMFYSRELESLSTQSDYINLGRTDEAIIPNLVLGDIYYFSLAHMNEDGELSLLTEPIQLDLFSESVNNAPNIISQNISTVLEVNSSYSFNLIATDPDNVDLFYGIQTELSDCTITQEGEIIINTQLEDEGIHQIVLTVSDYDNGFDKMIIELVVSGPNSFPSVHFNRPKYNCQHDFGVVEIFDILQTNNPNEIDSIYFQLDTSELDQPISIKAFETENNSRLYSATFSYGDYFYTSNPISVNQIDTLYAEYTNSNLQTTIDFARINFELNQSTISLGEDVEFCPGDSVLFTVPDEINNWIWSNGSVLGEIYVSETAELSIITLDADNCLSFSDTINVTEISSQLNPIITSDGNILSTSNEYESYQWFINDEIIIGANNYEITPTILGDYIVVITTIDGCEIDSDIFTITEINSTLESITELNSVKIYPNPTIDYLSIQSSPNLIKTVTVFNLKGEVVFEKNGINMKFCSVKLNALSEGSYFVLIDLDNGTNERFIFEKIK